MLDTLPLDCVVKIAHFLDSVEDICSFKRVVKFDWTCKMIRIGSKKKLETWNPSKNGVCCVCKKKRLTMIIFKNTCISWIPYCELHAPSLFLKEFDLYISK